MSTVPERPDFARPSPSRLFVAVPEVEDEGGGSSHGRRIAMGAIVAGLVLAIVVGVVALVDRGHGSPSPAARSHRVATLPTHVVLPVVIGSHVQLAQSILQSDGFAVHVRTVSGGGAAGMVVGQKPAGGRPVAARTPVYLTVSNG